jgi:sulfoacetaldehyde acetyltransferase
MADGFSRASGRHGVCIAQNGPGITNFVTSIAAAFWAHSPVVCITPETGTGTQGLGGFQEAEQLPFFERSRSTRSTARTRPASRAALALLRLRPAGARADAVQHPARPVLRRVRRRDPAADPGRPGPGAPESLDEAVALLSTAEFPVILSGGGVVMGDGVDAVVRLAEHLSAP